MIWRAQPHWPEARHDGQFRPPLPQDRGPAPVGSQDRVTGTQRLDRARPFGGRDQRTGQKAGHRADRHQVIGQRHGPDRRVAQNPVARGKQRRDLVGTDGRHRAMAVTAHDAPFARKRREDRGVGITAPEIGKDRGPAAAARDGRDMADLGPVADQKRQVPVPAPVEGEDPLRLKPRPDAEDRAIGAFQRLGIEGQQERPLTQSPLGRRADPSGGAIGIAKGPPAHRSAPGSRPAAVPRLRVIISAPDRGRPAKRGKRHDGRPFPAVPVAPRFRGRPVFACLGSCLGRV